MRADANSIRQINVTPYIDILLVLLIIFMVVNSRAPFDLKTRLPEQESESQVETQTTAVVVSLDSLGGIRINQEEVSARDLGIRLFEVLSRRPDKRLFVMAAPDLPFAEVIRVIDIAKGAGAVDIGLM